MDLDSHAMQQAIEAEILEKRRLAPNGSTNMANLLGDKQHLAMPELYLIKLGKTLRLRKTLQLDQFLRIFLQCSQGKVRLQQTGQELDNLNVTLISEQQDED